MFDHFDSFSLCSKQGRARVGWRCSEANPVTVTGSANRTRELLTTDSQSSEEKRAEEKSEQEARDEKNERKIDRDLEDSFPASDPPG